MNEDFKPYFKWTEFVFGNNLMAACAQLVLGAGALAVVFALVWFAAH